MNLSSFSSAISTPQHGIQISPEVVHNPSLLTDDIKEKEASGFYVKTPPGPYAGLQHLMTHEFGHAVTCLDRGLIDVSPLLTATVPMELVSTRTVLATAPPELNPGSELWSTTGCPRAFVKYELMVWVL